MLKHINSLDTKETMRNPRNQKLKVERVGASQATRSSETVGSWGPGHWGKPH